ncbi:mucin-5AC isoform X1 [Rhodamnia argentea]|uniref:Mucin-5AC isoform X1 n=2 Tax=Rhodamnia argentea TaxID=178133 RepID=A0A8B8PJK3_9MYRT|nr:mucin-5AC isoform X1 [Rhodamnia argentea]
MNRSFRAQESRMLGHRQQQMMKDKEEDLALFLEMRKREKERNDLLLNNAEEEFDAPLGSKPGSSPIFNIAPSAPPRKTATDDFLNSDSDKNDYDWLLTPPGTPLFPSLEMESQKTVMSQLGTPKARPTVLKSRLANSMVEPPARTNVTSRQTASSPASNNSGTGIRRPSSSGGPGSRPATPTSRPTLTTSSRASRPSTPTSRPTLSSSKSTGPVKPSVAASRPAGTSTKPAVSAAKQSVPARSSTPSRSTGRSSTPTARPIVNPPKPASRAGTPTRRPFTTSTGPTVSAPPTKAVSSTIAKSASTTSRNPVPSRGTSPTMKSRPWKPSEMPGFSLDAPPNLRTTLPDRPLSATRGRPGAPSSRSSSVEPGPTTRPRRQSCSPSRGRPANGVHHTSGSSVPAVSRGHPKINDNVSPVLIGTKMVDRVINMRKLMPPKQDDKHSPRSNMSGKSASSPDSSGFGRTLSKKSLDMAIRHMDIRRSIPGNLRPLMTNIPASSMYSVRSGPTRSRTVSVSDSPLATSSNASSEVSVNNNGLCMEGNGLDDDITSDRDGHSPTRGRRL